MPSARSLFRFAWAALVFSLVITASACGGDDASPKVTPTEAPTATPYSLGSSVTIRGEEFALPEGVSYINQTADCQLEANASSDTCINDFKMLVRGNSYILFDPEGPQVIARLIEPQDESYLRPLLDAIAGIADGASPDQSPGS